MTTTAHSTIGRLRGQLVVSCQAATGTPFEPTVHIVALARSAVLGGAKAVRIEGVDNVRAVRAAVDVPIIGIVKAQHPGFEAFITTQTDEVEGLVEAGAEIIAFDATDRARPMPVADLVAHILGRGCGVMADISTFEEARHAIASGAHVAGTTLAGYTSYSSDMPGPDFALMRALAAARLAFVAEGRIWSPAEAAQALELGAQFVVVGSAITRPDEITRRYAQAMEAAGRSALVASA